MFQNVVQAFSVHKQLQQAITHLHCTLKQGITNNVQVFSVHKQMFIGIRQMYYEWKQMI